MTTYQTIHIGTSHTNYCEDYLLAAEIGENKWLFAVLDGCSMGNESYFASALSGKILKKIAVEQGFLQWKEGKQQLGLESLLKNILARFFEEYKHIANRLLLHKRDLLATLVLWLYDAATKEGEILVIGDGVVCVDGKVVEFDQNNRPDYLGYHLEEDFEEWYSKQNQRIAIKNAKDVSIATDGILTFDTIDGSTLKKEVIDAINLLLIDSSWAENQQMLFRKILLLEKKYGLKPIDDVAIIRGIL